MNNLFLDGLAVELTSGATWALLYVALLYVVIRNSRTMTQILLITLCVALCLLLTAGVNECIVKPLVGRLRPTMNYSLRCDLHIVRGIVGSGFSFFSSHGANTFGLATFFALLFRSRLVAFALYFWALLNCWTRLYLGVHFPSDVLCGVIWGLLSGFVAYTAYVHFAKRLAISPRTMHPSLTPTGYNKRDLWVIVLALLLLLFYCLMRALWTCQ